MSLTLRNFARLLATALWLPCVLLAQERPEQYGPKPTGAAKALAQYETNRVTYKGNPDKLVLPGLVADRKARTVEVLAESTGLKDRETVEFLLVDQASEHGYEAMLWSFAKPSDVHQALTFIGLEPGEPFNPAALRFAPAGDRVMLNVRTAAGQCFPIERLILDTETKTTLPESGFVFAGSVQAPSPDGKNASCYVADFDEARSVASIYNEPATVLDVPRQVNKNEAYERQVVNPEQNLPGGELLTLVLTPGNTNGQLRAQHLVLSIDRAAVSNDLICRLNETGGKILQEERTITPVLERLVSMGRGEAPLYVSLVFGRALPLADVRKVCQLMAMLEHLAAVRSDPPAAGQLFYRAFVPDPSWLKPEGRPTQPWELHLRKQDGRISGQLVQYVEARTEGNPNPVYSRKAVAVADPQTMRARLEADMAEGLAAGTPRPPVLLVYAEAGLNYGEMLQFVEPVRNTHGTVYVFLQE